MTFEELLRDIQSGKFQPVYLLHGEEPYFTDRILDAIETHALPESERSFNLSVLYGKEVDAVTLLDYLRRYPMMSERQVVVLREAQDMKGLADLQAYIENPMPTTVFAIGYKHKKLDLNTKFGKALKAKAVVLESKRLYDNQIPDWIVAYCKSQKRTIEPTATNLLAEYLGSDLAKVSNEIDKLVLNLSPGAPITAAQVQEYVGISKDYNVFELHKAMAMRDIAKVMRIEQYYAANIKRNSLLGTIASLFNFFSKVYMLHFLAGKSDSEAAKTLALRSEWALKEYRIAAKNYPFAKVCAVISLLREFDLRAKGVDSDSADEDALMKELFFRILH